MPTRRSIAVLLISIGWLGMIASVLYALAVNEGGFALDGARWPVLSAAGCGGQYGSAITSLFVLLPRLGAVNNMAILNFEPIAVLGIAWVLLGQAVSALQVLGAFVVIGAILWMGGRR